MTNLFLLVGRSLWQRTSGGATQENKFLGRTREQLITTRKCISCRKCGERCSTKCTAGACVRACVCVCLFKRIASRCVIKNSPIEQDKQPHLATLPERPPKVAQSSGKKRPIWQHGWTSSRSSVNVNQCDQLKTNLVWNRNCLAVTKMVILKKV